MRSLLVMFFMGVLALMLVGCGEDKPPEPQTGSITVTAMYLGEGLDSAFVALSLSSDTAAELVASGTTMDGECVISGLAPSEYAVTVSKSVGGQLIYGAQSNVQVSAGATATQTVQVDQQKADYFPLALGNLWRSSDGADTATIGVFSTKVVKGVLTYTIGPESGGHPGYHTRGVSAVYIHGWETQTGGDHILEAPVVFLDFSASEHDTWSIPDWGTVEVVEKGLEITVPVGTFSGCDHFKFTAAGVVVSDWWNAPGIGPIRMADSSGVISELISYELH